MRLEVIIIEPECNWYFYNETLVKYVCQKNPKSQPKKPWARVINGVLRNFSHVAIVSTIAGSILESNITENYELQPRNTMAK